MIYVVVVIVKFEIIKNIKCSERNIVIFFTLVLKLVIDTDNVVANNSKG